MYPQEGVNIDSGGEMKRERRNFLCLAVTAPGEVADLLSCLLFELGCRGIEVLSEGTAWRARGFFEETARRDLLARRIARAGRGFLRSMELRGSVRVRWKIVKAWNWEERWQASLRPFRIGRRIVVRPSRCDYNPRPGEIVVTMDARVAFGSGHHETTKLAARALESTVREGCSVLDAGAGSGILAIIAAKLGAARVVAVEVDEASYENMVENVTVNGLGERVETMCASLAEAPRERFDLAAANLDRAGLLAGMEDIAARLTAGGTALLTGFLSADCPEIRERVETLGLASVSSDSMGEWCLLRAQK